MNAERWQLVKDLFESALKLPINERNDFLAQACANDSALMAEIESLIEYHQKAGSFLESPAINNLANDSKIPETEISPPQNSSVKPLENISTDPFIGKTFDSQYEIESLLGVGGMGAVYRANHKLLKRQVAIKVMSSKLTDDPNYRKLFIREGRAATLFNHPNAVTIYDLRETTEGIVYLVLEFIEGRSLSEELRKRGSFSIQQACELIIPIAEALATAHKNGVVHRDLKPANIMVSNTPSLQPVKLLDLGIAKLTQNPLSTDTVSALTITQNILGTPHYMSPEQWAGDKGLDGRADIYSLGIILYELVAGQRPFKGPTMENLAYQHTIAMPTPLHEIIPTIPESFSNVVLKAIAKDANHRHSTCNELVEELKIALNKIEIDKIDKIDKIIPTDPLATIPNTQPIAIKQNNQNNRVNNSKEIKENDSPKTIAFQDKRLIYGLVTTVTIILVVVITGQVLVNSHPKSAIGASPVIKPTPITTTNPSPKFSGEIKGNIQEYQFKTARLDQNDEIQTFDKQSKSFTISLGNNINLEMVLIPASSFVMGNSSESPQLAEHTVNISAFAMSKFEITQAQWQAMAMQPKVNIELNPTPAKFKGDDLPVESISWVEAKEFCARLAKLTKQNYNLPTESQWEYACRAGTTTKYSFGEKISLDLVNYGGRETKKVGSYNFANNFGLYDISGNVWEWCLDPWHEDYKDAPSDGQVWQSAGDETLRVIRGGSWTSNLAQCTSAYRSAKSLGDKLEDVGFRVVLSQ